MKLSDHVDKIRNLITASFDKQFARLGIGAKKQIELEKLPEQVRAKRKHLAVMLENHIGETGCYQDAREKLLDELSFTLFNRLAAVKVMESANLFPPVITKQAEHGGRSFGHKAWLEEYPESRESELEGIRDYFKHAFNELGDSLPLYSKEYPYALLPDAISLNEIIEAFNAIEEDSQVEDDIWQSDDVLGWLYESYNKAKNQAFKDSKAKTEYDKVSLQSQVYTPRWVVQFLVENSLGKLYLEMYPESEIKEQFKIANAPKIQERKPKPVHEIKLIDPASGSGNFLLYAFDFFYALYIDQIENYDADYDEDDIPKLIIENNLHGIDLDDRAIQLAQLGLYIKARKKRRFIKGSFNFKVISSDFYLPAYNEVRHIFERDNQVSNEQQSFIEKVWGDLQHAYKFGSLIHIDKELKDQLTQIKILAEGDLVDMSKKLKSKPKEADIFAAADFAEHKAFAENFFTNLVSAVEQYAKAGGNKFISSKTRDAITFLELLTTEYDIATANPPYTDCGDFGPELKSFIEKNYKKPYKCNTNLYAAFIKRCYELILPNGYIVMVHPQTLLYIKTFEDTRKFILDKTHINIFVEWGYLGMFDTAVRTDSIFYILEKTKKENTNSIFIKLDDIYEGNRLLKFNEIYDQYLMGNNNPLLYSIPQSKLKIIKSWPFIYWISDGFRNKFTESPLQKVADVVSGVKTGNNNGALRLWWELNQKDIFDGKNQKKWVKYTKGGKFRKWQGNNWLCVDWRNDCQFIKSQNSCNIPLEKYSFVEGINYSGSGQKGICFRYLEEYVLYDMGSSAVFPKFDLLYAIAILNSKLVFYISDCLNPTVNKQPNDVKRIPLPKPTPKNMEYLKPLSKKNINIYKYLEKYSIIEMAFEESPLISFFERDTKNSIKNFLNHENHILSQVIITEAIINHKVFEIYDLTELDKEMVIVKEGESIGDLPVCHDARDSYLVENEATNEFPLDSIRDFIKALPSKEFTNEERESIENGLPSLYQSNNDLEEFCIRHQVNPINIWYWFKQSNVIPKQRINTLAVEFLADMIREILMEDEDGIIPLVPNAGEKILLNRIEDKFIEKGFSTAQYSGFDSLLARPIDEYLNKYFFTELSEHLNLYMYLPKAPFIWHLTSGSEQGFDCFIIIYKWNRDNLMRIRSVYIEHRERALMNRQSDLANNESVDAQNEKDKIFKQLKEIEVFKVKIDELLEEGYDPIIDDGVGKNIAPLQKKKMLAYDVLNAGQLKKYLNADW